jgi:hypothetical protein
MNEEEVQAEKIDEAEDVKQNEKEEVAPNVRKRELGLKKIQEYIDEEAKIHSRLDELKRLKTEVGKAIQSVTKNATLGECLKMNRRANRQPIQFVNPLAKVHIPMVPGALNPEEQVQYDKMMNKK